jgi:hypothetical protein
MGPLVADESSNMGPRCDLTSILAAGDGPGPLVAKSRILLNYSYGGGRGDPG